MPVRPIDRPRRPWNKGLLIGQKKPLEPKHVWSIRVRLEIAQSRRDLAIFNLAIDSKLRACDLVKLRLDDICSGANVRHRATIVQKKTGRPVQIRNHGTVEEFRGRMATNAPRHGFPISFPKSTSCKSSYINPYHAWADEWSPVSSRGRATSPVAHDTIHVQVMRKMRSATMAGLIPASFFFLSPTVGQTWPECFDWRLEKPQRFKTTRLPTHPGTWRMGPRRARRTFQGLD